VVLALGAATVVLADLEVLPSDLMPAFVTEGEVGKVVTTRSFKVRIDKPFVARELVVRELSFGDPKQLTTGGVWLVVPAAVQPQLEPLQFDGATIQAKSGKTYASSGRLPDTFQPGAHGASPGIAFLGSWVFEIPPEEIPGAKLLVSEGLGEAVLESQARIDLGAGADLVEKAVPKYEFKKDDS
jgi:hypothetical protein